MTGAALDEANYPEGDALLADGALGPVATTVRVTNAGNQSADPAVVWTKNRTWVYWGQMWFDGKAYRFSSWMYDNMLVKVDGEVILRQTQTGYPTTSAVLMPEKGWHDIEIRVFNGNDENAGPLNAGDVNKGWNATHGFGIATTGASGNSFLGFEYPYAEDDGTGSLFRYDAGEEATSNVTYDHETVFYENHTLVFAAGEDGSVSSAGGACAANATLSVTATPSAGYRFVRWDGDVAEGQSFVASVAVPGNRDRTITAVFEPDAAVSEKKFSGASGGKWNVDANWTPGGVPSPSDAVVIPNGKNVELDVYADVGSLTLEGNACLSANFASGKITTRQRTALDQVSTATIGLDVRGNLTAERYYGADGAPCLRKDGFAEIRCEYDVRGNKIAERYYDEDGNPTLVKDGFAEVRCKYDTHGNLTTEWFYGEDGEPCIIEDGYAGSVMEYDARGNLTVKRFYGTDGKPTMAMGAFAELHFEYNAIGEVVHSKSYDIDGKEIEP